MKKYDKTKFDERQILERGKAFQYGFITITCLMVVFFPLYDAFELRIFNTNFRFYICLYPAITVCLTYMIIKDAYDGISNGFGSILWTLWGVLGFVEIITTLIKMIKQGIPFVTNGILYDEIRQFVMGFCFIIIGIVSWAHIIRRKKKASNEE